MLWIGYSTTLKSNAIEVITTADAENLCRVTNHFHDCCIAQYEHANDEIHIRLDSSYGFLIDLWFKGDVACSLNLLYLVERGDPDWQIASVLLQNDYIYLVDNTNVNLDKLSNELCWFRGKWLWYNTTPKEKL